jgi:hypothetical protein
MSVSMTSSACIQLIFLLLLYLNILHFATWLQCLQSACRGDAGLGSPSLSSRNQVTFYGNMNASHVNDVPLVSYLPVYVASLLKFIRDSREVFLPNPRSTVLANQQHSDRRTRVENTYRNVRTQLSNLLISYADLQPDRELLVPIVPIRIEPRVT